MNGETFNHGKVNREDIVQYNNTSTIEKPLGNFLHSLPFYDYL